MTRSRWIYWGLAMSILAGAFTMQGDLIPAVAFSISATFAFSEAHRIGKN